MGDIYGLARERGAGEVIHRQVSGAIESIIESHIGYEIVKLHEGNKTLHLSAQ